MEHDKPSPQADASAENAKYLTIIGNSQNLIVYFIALKTPGKVSSCHTSWVTMGRLAYLDHTLPEVREMGYDYFRHYLHHRDLKVLDETLKKLQKRNSERLVTALYRAQDKYRDAYFWYYCQVSPSDYFPDGSIREVMVNVFELSTDMETIDKMTTVLKCINNLGLQELFKKLSRRQLEVLGMIVKGNTDKEIAEMLGIMVGSVRTYHQRIRVQTKIPHKGELIALAIQSGLFD